MLLQGDDLVRYKEILVDELSYFDKFCKENGIKYFAVGGTAIGAVRHKGFIPWDDDIDVAMFREDYDRFCALKHKLENTKYRIVDYHDKGYYNPGAKFIDISTTLWEYELQTISMGAYIDVFPFDVSDGNADVYQAISCKIKRSFKNLERSKLRASFSFLWWALRKGHIPTLLRCIVNFLYYNHKEKQCIKEVEQNEDMLRKQVGDFVLYYSSFYPIDKELNTKETFATTIKMPFESTTIEMPVGYDKYLRNLYGDYMELPPKEKQKPHHPLHYYNLSEHLSIEEIKKRHPNLNYGV